MSDIPDRIVPCAGCTACCRAGLGVRLVPADALDAFPQRDPIMDKDDPTLWVGWALPQKENGECHYLVDGRCSVYDRRPHMCRGFDCRDMTRDPATRALAEAKPHLREIIAAADARPS